MEKSWDQHRVPKPFTTVVLSRGEPIYVPPDLDEEQFDAMMRKVEEAMVENMEVCKRKVRELRGE